MKIMTTLTGSARALLTSVAIAWCGAQAQGAEVPAYLKPIIGTQTASPAEVGTKNILQLNASMFELYDASGKIFQRNFLAQHPLILGLFSGAGGRFILCGFIQILSRVHLFFNSTTIRESSRFLRLFLTARLPSPYRNRLGLISIRERRQGYS